MISKFILVCLALIGFYSNTYATFSLNVLQPHRNNWYKQQATIETADLSIEPNGIYWEYTLTLSFSARNVSFGYNDSVEIEYFFELPAGSHIHESYLWIGNTIAQAKLIDRITATNIYEGIVKRRRDPSILYKNSATQYELRIYPMDLNETRKVKLQFLIPVEFNANAGNQSLLLPFIKPSRNIPDMNVTFGTSTIWNTPTRINSILVPTSQGANAYSLQIPSQTISTTDNIYLSMKSAARNGLLFCKYPTSATEGYYQVAFSPKDALGILNPKKVVILINHSSMGSDVYDKVISNIKYNLRTKLEPTDSFVVMAYINGLLYQSSEIWQSIPDRN